MTSYPYSTQQMVDLSRLGLTNAEVGEMAQVLQHAIVNRTPVRSGFLRSTVGVMGMDDGKFVISMAYYGWILNRGFKGYFMKQLQGKTVPIRLPNGNVIFRKATNVGAHRINRRDPTTGRIVSGNSPYAWRHPGVRPMRFVEAGIADGFRQMAPAIVQIQLGRMMQEFMQLRELR